MAAVVALLVMATLAGCLFRKLREDVTRLNAVALIGGKVTCAAEEQGPIVVVLTTTAPPVTVVDFFVLAGSGAYFFAVPHGAYRIVAFVDRNRDFVYEPADEPAAYYGAPTDIHVDPGQKIAGLDMHIGPDPGVRLNSPIDVSQLGKSRGRGLPDIELGTVVTMDDPRFSDENAHLGLWQPVEFLFQVGAGFYFLEEFDPNKMPVLFVHGAGGQPGNFRYLIEHLDRTRFQPWLYYYPSGLDIDAVAEAGGRWLTVLGVRYEVQRLAVVAHSMGGLVARAAINRAVAATGGRRLAVFVSISTPWNGHAAAGPGAEHAPVVIPMWRDIAPGSPFLVDLFRTPLPRQCPYYLLFSYSGHSAFVSGANDGTVALSSELALPAQLAATKVYGFDENHDSILTSAETSATLNALLASAAR